MYVFFVIKITNLIQDFGSKMLYHLTVSLDDRLRRRQYHVELLCIDCLIKFDNYVFITITGSIPLLVDY
jgi:hypothetical protein